jgi:hypothetical protein
LETYEFKPEFINLKLGGKVLVVLCSAVLFFLLFFGWNLLYPSAFDQAGGKSSVAIQAGVLSLICGIAFIMQGPFRSSRVPHHKLLVDDKSITWVTQHRGIMKWLVTRRTVRKGKVQTIFEIKGRFGIGGGIGISEKSPPGSRKSGFVYVPKSLPQYDHLRQLAESWRVSELTK